ncbi:MAG: hypothetical protein IJM59_13445 [Proteobacteria bacterium]|nr:hypothetical protein [Pseudomonadota bacterium]
MAGCSSKQPQSSNPEQTGINHAQKKSNGTVSEAEKGPQICPNGSKPDHEKCICADGSEWLGESWYCLLNGQRCYNKDGCRKDDKDYPFGSDYRKAPPDTSKDITDDDTITEKTQYVCHDNTWIPIQVKRNDNLTQWYPKDEYEQYDNDYHCGGIPIKALGKEGEFEACEQHDKNCRSNAYRCRYNHWVCAEKDGCSCFDGYETKKIQLHDFCENRKCNESLSDDKKSDVYNSDNSSWTDAVNFEIGTPPEGLCLEDSCPCGDGACMKFGVCTDGVCTCHNIKTNLHDEFYCNHYYVEFPYCPGDCDVDEGGILTCDKEGGCHTLDGRHYPKGAAIGHNKVNADLPAKEDSALFHIDAGFDTTIESISSDGECVLDRTDSMKRWSELGDDATKIDKYICDKSDCLCGQNTQCRVGEICNHGKCVADKCNAQSATRLICDVHLEDGRRAFQFPDEPGICIDPYDIKEQTCPMSYELYFGIGFDLCDFEDDYSDDDDEDNSINDKTKDTFSPIARMNLQSKGKMYYDTYKCEGGHRYCHGKNNDPIVISDNPSGWDCESVVSLPGTESKTDLKAWICKLNEGCLCNNTPCGYLKSCIDGQCIEVSQPQDYCHGANNDPIKISSTHEGWECKDVTALPGVEAKTDIKAWICQKDSGCMCEDTLCSHSQACIDGKCVDVGLELCDGKPLQKGYICKKAQNGVNGGYRDVGMICALPECICGNSHCAKDAICRNGRCIDDEFNPLVYSNTRCDNDSGCLCNGKTIE